MGAEHCVFVQEQDIVDKARKIEVMMKKWRHDAKRRKESTEKNRAILPPAGGALLRSYMLELPAQEQQVWAPVTTTSALGSTWHHRERIPHP